MVSNYPVRIILVFIILAFFNSASFAQKEIIKSLEFGISINHLTGIGDTGKAGYGLSIRKIWRYPNRINIISGLLFEKTKFLEDYVPAGPNNHYSDLTFSMYYFAVPFMARINFGKKFRIFCEAGPALEIIPLKYGKGTSYSYQSLTATTDISEVSDDFNHSYLILGANAGLGILIPMPGFMLITGASFHEKIINITNNGLDDPAQFVSLRIGFTLR